MRGVGLTPALSGGEGVIFRIAYIGLHPMLVSFALSGLKKYSPVYFQIIPAKAQLRFIVCSS